VQLFDKDFLRATDSLEPSAVAAASVDLLHIPTPWHNCVVEVAGAPFTFVTKSGVVDDAIKSGALHGGWVAGEGSRGGYFHLESPLSNVSEDELSSAETLVGDAQSDWEEELVKAGKKGAMIAAGVDKWDATDEHENQSMQRMAGLHQQTDKLNGGIVAPTHSVDWACG
jgi:hypothetical protein